jgi:IS30 family transposase
VSLYEDIAALAADGQSAGQIARALSLTRGTVQRALKRGAPARYESWDKVSDAEVNRRLTALVKRLEAEDREQKRR